MLYPTSSKEFLLPKSLRLDANLHHEVAGMWDQFHAISRTPREGYSDFRIFNEADANEVLGERVYKPIIDVFKGLKACVARQEANIAGVDRNLEATLRQALSFSYRLQGPRSLGQETRPTPTLDADRHLNLQPFLDTGPTNPRPHLLSRSLADPNSPWAGTLDTHIYQLPDDVAIEETKRYFATSIPDTTLYWAGGRAGPASRGGIPFLITEVKDPHRVTANIMEEVLLHFDRHTSDQWERARFFETQAIPVRRAVSTGHTDTLATLWLKGFGQAYRHAFLSRQVYGTYSTAEDGMLFKINWDHPTHPGQHVTAVMIKSNPPSSVPPYPAADVIQDRYHYFAASGGLQMSTGLVPTDRFLSALAQLNGEHKTNSPQATQPRPTGTESTSQPGGQQDSSDAEIEQEAPMSGNEDRGFLPTGTTTTALALPDLQAFYHAVLDCYPDSACKEEIRRFFALDERKVVLQFRKTELLKMLCAAFPLDPVRAFSDPANTLSLEDLLALAPNTHRSSAQLATDYHIFWWGTLEEGLLPKGFSARLARLDASEEVQSRTELINGDVEDPSTDDDPNPPTSPPTPPQ
ncbi:hypothetical protein sr15674 [Sporisorium reilianum SRZ2]|uniref:Uncharacterized protein n=1 Tax=Sporisorium reilianum (strain SRZ2) TaxID=999809 RepID=E6ZR98_SPORE|nr:hypothetical protein sr15674 [Sporisorium reilianum SRZ2]